MDQSEEKARHVTNFNALPNELVLAICRYLKPAEVLQIFFDDHDRFSDCIQEYHQSIDLTKSSHGDLKYFSKMLGENVLSPRNLTVSNARIPTQLSTLFSKCNLSITFYPRTIQYLHLLDFTQINIHNMSMFLSKFPALHLLSIIQSTTDQHTLVMDSLISETFLPSIFNSFPTLIQLELTVNNGIVLDKQLLPNHYLTHLLISLQTIDDLYVLLDGCVPNLHALRVALCQSNVSK